MNRSLVERVAERLDRLARPDATVLVAVSGGPDSLALLDLLHSGLDRHRRPLVVGHVDHGISAASTTVARDVAGHAARYNLPFHMRALELGSRASETTARRGRRAALRQIAKECGAASIALGHHARDQAETVLLRVLAGSGPAGLAGMAARRGPWLRPLLGVEPAELLVHLEAAGLSPWQDPANSDPTHLRSWLRITALPLLEERFKGVHSALLALAAQAARDRAAWNQVPELLAELDLQRERGAISVAAAVLKGYRSEVQDAVVSALARRLGVPVSAKRRSRVRQILLGGRSGAKVNLGPVLEAEVTFDRLVLRRPVASIGGVPLSGQGSVEAGSARFVIREAVADGSRVDRGGWRTWLSPGNYLIRSWRPGDRIRPLGGTGSRTVAVLFKEAHVASGARRGWPVLVPAEDDATIVWVPGICRSGQRLPVAGKEALDVECALA